MALDALTTSAFEGELNQLRLEQRVSTHPFMQKLEAGELTMDQVKVFLIEFYFHTVMVPKTLAQLVARCRVPELHAGLSEGLYEEYTGRLTGSRAHPQLYWDALAPSGLTKEFVLENAFLLPGMSALVNWYHYATTDLNPLVGIAALTVGAEGQNVSLPGDLGLSGRLAKGLKEHYGWNDDEALKFFVIHDEADQEHSTAGVRLLDRFATTDDEKEMVRAAIRVTQRNMWAAFDDMLTYSFEEATVNNCALFY
jgi:pyrroloquinoline-quinone synthase